MKTRKRKNETWRQFVERAHPEQLQKQITVPVRIRMLNITNNEATLLALYVIMEKGLQQSGRPFKNLTGTQAGILNIEESEVLAAQQRLIELGYIEIVDDVVHECSVIRVDKSITAPSIGLKETTSNNTVKPVF